MSKLQVGVDVGGTFTDVVLHDADSGDVTAAKALSTPAAPVDGVMDGIRHALEARGADARGIGLVRHGTTIATNAVLERRGARTALLVTKGFRDVLYVGRQARPSLYNLRTRHPAPIVPRHLTHEVDERTTWSGHVERPVDERQIGRIARRLREQGVEAVAVCLLHAYVNGANEAAIRGMLRAAMPGVAVCLSSEISPQIGEYERANTTAMNAYVMPAVASYVEGLLEEAGAFGPGCGVYIMQSNGGAMGPELAASRSVHTMFSGPAGGAIAARHFAQRAGLPNVISVDVGGTSADVAVIAGGQLQESREGRIAGLPIRIPVLEIHSVGAGGGSIAWIDAGGALRVGPQSAGAVPGPICYRRGGESPTVTDAHVALGNIGADAALGGRVAVDAEAAAQGIRRAIAEPLGLSLQRAAAGIIEVANATMVRAIRVLTVERGLDPEDFVLLAFGGAGPLHAVALARALGIRTVAVPPYAGVLSAVGMLASTIRHDFVRTHIARTLELDAGTVRRVFADIREEALEVMRREGFAAEEVALEGRVGVRYVGQAFDLPVPVPDLAASDGAPRALEEAFQAAHRRRYGFAVQGEPTEVVSFAVTATVGSGEFRCAGQHPGAGDARGAISGEREAWFGEARRATPVYRRERLPVGARLAGPAVVEGEDTTILLPPGSSGEVTPAELFVIRLDGEGAR